MDSVLTLITLVVAYIICVVLFTHLGWIRNGVKKGNKGLGKTLPEPAGSWPIIGHLHLFAGSKVPHRLLGSLADKYGPIFNIKVGVHRFLVVSTSEMAKEFLSTNDIIFASRPKMMAVELLGYNGANFALGPYGPFWLAMNKIAALELVPYRRHQMLSHVRVSEVTTSIKNMYKTWTFSKGSSNTVKVDMKQWFRDLIVNILSKMIFGDRFSTGEQKGEQFKKALTRFPDLMGEFVPSDVFPCLRWLDLGGCEKKMKTTAKELDLIMDEWLEEYKTKMNSTPCLERKDQSLMAALLSRVKQEVKEDAYGFSTDAIVKATCLAIYSGGTDATILTLTWALSLLVSNPLVLRKAQEEVENYVGRDRIVEESDLKNFVYLQAIVKETMRLYPPVPSLLPRECTEDCVVGGYVVPKGTRLLINSWKIQHDPEIWNNPFEFQPERFLTSNKDIDVKGQHFKLLPFGGGRRICPGLSLAHEDIMLILATIIHAFEFQIPSKEEIDMTEKPEWAIIKATPLELLVAPRLLPDLYQV
ncbi:putative cytochrome P450 [Helianthus annuus]|nr:putative cytochrome P450 [Helianthus annuus]KAJ0577810.1 putative cytochrome P450 [Helianthus annuus]